jgi:hypothetical protein
MECIYNLMTFGIASDVLPITPAGELKLEAHQEFVRRLRIESELSDDVHRIIIPGTYDVLLGRGKPLQKHPGNLCYHHTIETYQGRYENAQKLEKTQISKFIVQKMKEDGGRFLKQDDAGWVEIDDDSARYKVSHTFRNHRIAARVQEKKALAVEEKATTLCRKHDESDSEQSTSYGVKTECTLHQKRRRVGDASEISSTS